MDTNDIRPAVEEQVETTLEKGEFSLKFISNFKHLGNTTFCVI